MECLDAPATKVSRRDHIQVSKVYSHNILIYPYRQLIFFHPSHLSNISDGFRFSEFLFDVSLIWDRHNIWFCSWYWIRRKIYSTVVSNQGHQICGTEGIILTRMGWKKFCQEVNCMYEIDEVYWGFSFYVFVPSYSGNPESYAVLSGLEIGFIQLTASWVGVHRGLFLGQLWCTSFIKYQ